jgi:hypothetical protein
LRFLSKGIFHSQIVEPAKNAQSPKIHGFILSSKWQLIVDEEFSAINEKIFIANKSFVNQKFESASKK